MKKVLIVTVLFVVFFIMFKNCAIMELNKRDEMLRRSEFKDNLIPKEIKIQNKYVLDGITFYTMRKSSGLKINMFKTNKFEINKQYVERFLAAEKRNGFNMKRKNVFNANKINKFTKVFMFSKKSEYEDFDFYITVYFIVVEKINENICVFFEKAEHKQGSFLENDEAVKQLIISLSK